MPGGRLAGAEQTGGAAWQQRDSGRHAWSGSEAGGDCSMEGWAGATVSSVRCGRKGGAAWHTC